MLLLILLLLLSNQSEWIEIIQVAIMNIIITMIIIIFYIFFVIITLIIHIHIHIHTMLKNSTMGNRVEEEFLYQSLGNISFRFNLLNSFQSIAVIFSTNSRSNDYEIDYSIDR